MRSPVDRLPLGGRAVRIAVGRRRSCTTAPLTRQRWVGGVDARRAVREPIADRPAAPLPMRAGELPEVFHVAYVLPCRALPVACPDGRFGQPLPCRGNGI